jgi:8-oxo-dGTP diphosphatase
VLIGSDGRVLLADRPQGKPYAGYWEFPGGKIEEGEHVGRALERELHEELGIEIEGSLPWVTFEYDYPHALVELQFRVVRRWRGEPHPREGQRLCFVDPVGELPHPLLPAAVPALRWLLLPRSILAGVKQKSSAGALSGSHGKATSEPAPYLIVNAGGCSLGGGSSREPEEAAIRSRIVRLDAAPAAGIVAEASEPAAPGIAGKVWKGAWADSERDLERASRQGCDFALVGSRVLAERLKASPGPLPAYVQDERFPECRTPDAVGSTVRWTELHPIACDSAD